MKRTLSRMKTRKSRKLRKPTGFSKGMATVHPTRKFMRLAIREMLQSKSEHATKIDPLVGAILVDPEGVVIGKAHRGKYSSGDHGEFTLLEKSGVRILPDSVLYVTLEPCTKRGSHKTPCVERVIKSGIKHVVIGISDPNPEIWGKGRDHLKQAGVRVGAFTPDLAEEIRTHNKEFIHEQEQRAEQLRSAQLRSPDREELMPIQEASVSDLSTEAIRLYVEKSGKAFKTPSNELWRHFRKAGFVVSGDTMRDWIPTLAGVVLFAKEPHQFLPQSRIKADQFPGSPDDPAFLENATALLDITGPLPKQIETALKFFNENVRKLPRVRGAVREVLAEYPEAVIREAIVNALVHRSYKTSAHIFFQMYRDRIVIKSPGLPAAPLTISMFPDEVISVARNPKIAQAAFVMGFMDARGLGIKNMPTRLRKYGLREPSFETDKGYFVVTLFGRELTPFTIRADRQLLATITHRQREIIEFAENKISIRTAEIVKMFNVSKETASKDFRQLIKLKIFGKAGTGSSTSYFLLKD